MTASDPTDADRAADRLPVGDPGARLERGILDLLAQRAADATICPSEAARLVAGEGGWRDLMQPARDAAARLVAAGEVEVTQGGEVVDVAAARGPVRIRRAGAS